MAFFTIAGTPYPVVAIREREPELIGDEGRTYLGKLRTNASGVKRSWDVDLNEISQASLLILRASVELAQQVTVAGDAFETSYTCRVTITEADYIRNKADFLRGVRLLVKQV